MANYSLILMLAIMLSLNVGLALYDDAVNSYNPDYDGFVQVNSSPLATFTSTGGLDGGLSTDVDLALPASSDTVDPDTGVIFTDSWKSSTTWLAKLNSALGFLGSILVQPAGFLYDVGVPLKYVVSFGALWYIILLFLIFSLVKGGGAS